MSVFRFDPARHFEAATRKMNDFMNDVDKGISVEFGGFSPRVDISENEKQMIASVELPGVNKQDVNKLSIKYCSIRNSSIR